MIDTHTHLNFQAFSQDWQQVVTNALSAGVSHMIVVGTDLETSKSAISLAQSHPNLFATVGIHPHHAKQYLKKSQLADQELIELSKLALQPKVVAIGEIGIDHHQYQVTKYTSIDQSAAEKLIEIQQTLFQKQLTLAANLQLPVILHSREAGSEVLDQIKTIETKYSLPISGVFHCFEGSKRYAKKIIDSGFYLSFTGNITYANDRQEVANLVPLNRLLLETDSPYMTPDPYRGQRNEPKNVTITAQCHARSRKISFTQLVDQTTINAQQLFKLS
jgi:TatD DNase family protein